MRIIMRYLELRQELSNYTVFSLADIRKLDGTFYHSRLNEWQKKGYIRKIISKYYMFSDIKIDDAALYCIANRIYSPSYVSLEMALSYHNLIPESVYAITSVSSRRKYSFETDIGQFYYRAMKPELFFGYEIVQSDNIAYKIADLEKSILDFLYLNPHYNTQKDFSELRFNQEVFWDNIDEYKLKSYVARFAQNKLSLRINRLLRVLKNDRY